MNTILVQLIIIKYFYFMFFFVCFFFVSGIFLAILGRGPRAFLIGKYRDVNLEFGKFSKYSQLIIFSNVTYLIKVFHLESLIITYNQS